MRRPLLKIALFATLVVAPDAAGVGKADARQTPSVATLKTTPEATEFKSTSSYEDVIRFVKAVDAASPNIHYTTYGKTFEGRDMPLVVVGTGLKDASPASVMASSSSCETKRAVVVVIVDVPSMPLE